MRECLSDVLWKKNDDGRRHHDLFTHFSRPTKSQCSTLFVRCAVHRTNSETKRPAADFSLAVVLYRQLE